MHKIKTLFHCRQPNTIVQCPLSNAVR